MSVMEAKSLNGFLKGLRQVPRGQVHYHLLKPLIQMQYLGSEVPKLGMDHCSLYLPWFIILLPSICCCWLLSETGY